MNRTESVNIVYVYIVVQFMTYIDMPIGLRSCSFQSCGGKAALGPGKTHFTDTWDFL